MEGMELHIVNSFTQNLPQNPPACTLTWYSASIVPYEAFPTSDGSILLGGGNDKLYGILCTRLGKEQWITDNRFRTNASRVQHRDILVPMIAEETKKKTTKVNNFLQELPEAF